MRGEQGVGIVLNPTMQKAWRHTGEFCEFAGSRLLRIKLRINNRLINVISVYAPTYNSEAMVKDAFYDGLNKMLGTIGSQEEVFILGDFNARVSRSTTTHPEELDESIIVGPFGLNHTNDNGERLLALCEGSKIGILRVMSTFFQHQHYGTWFHNSSRKWFQIDHVLAARRSAKFVMDVAAKPGIGFDSDHRLVKTKLRFSPLAYHGQAGSRGRQMRQFNTKLSSLNVARFQQAAQVDQLNGKMEEFLHADLIDEYETWSYGLRKAAEQAVGVKKLQHMPQWKIDCQAELEELSKFRYEAYTRWCQGGSKTAYRLACKQAKSRINDLLNAWWTSKATIIQRQIDEKQPQHQYAGFRELRSILHLGKRPVPKLRNEHGEFEHTKQDRLKRWQAYFFELLNVPSKAEPDYISTLTSLMVDAELASIPTMVELVAAVHRLKPGKAGGPDGIPGEAIKSLNLLNLRVLLKHFVRVWLQLVPMPEEWKAGYIVPLPKKGDPTICSNWRGITLLSVPGKLFARIIAARLYQYAETKHILPEWQCGFRGGRSTIDMIFTIRMILETAKNKKVPIFLLFIDLIKSYDSVAQAGLWKVL